MKTFHYFHLLSSTYIKSVLNYFRGYRIKNIVRKQTNRGIDIIDNNRNRKHIQIDKLTIFGNKYRILWTKKSKPRLRESCSLILISASVLG